MSVPLYCVKSKEIKFDRRLLNPGERVVLMEPRLIDYGVIMIYGDGDPHVVVELRIDSDIHIIEGNTIVIEPVSNKSVSIAVLNVGDTTGYSPTIEISFIYGTE